MQQYLRTGQLLPGMFYGNHWWLENTSTGAPRPPPSTPERTEGCVSDPPQPPASHDQWHREIVEPWLVAGPVSTAPAFLEFCSLRKLLRCNQECYKLCEIVNFRCLQERNYHGTVLTLPSCPHRHPCYTAAAATSKDYYERALAAVAFRF